MRPGSPQPDSAIFVPPRRRPADPGPAAEPVPWTELTCADVVVPALRDVMWRYVRGVAHLVHTGVRAPDEPVGLSALNDGRAPGVKVAMLATENAGVCLILRIRPPREPVTASRRWRDDLGREGVRPGAAVVSGIEQVAPEVVAPLLPEPPSPHARPWVVLRTDVRDRTGRLSVDPGDGLLRPAMELTVLRLYGTRPAGERPARCPGCDRPRVRRYTAFDLCPDCGWARQPGVTPGAPAGGLARQPGVTPGAPEAPSPDA
ncbi:hypothetical protein ACPCHT_05940 [Nucisporomicrobium flavum]|uniref:hypothetical protein n=1 Tax=Nucisporomicrobium flavum TaxID=2785915 RepID=UPI003C2CA694